jgi:hypothetical protein
MYQKIVTDDADNRIVGRPQQRLQRLAIVEEFAS